jgi:hypothetical protein
MTEKATAKASFPLPPEGGRQEIQIFMCGGRCSAGGKDEDEGHIWDQEQIFYDVGRNRKEYPCGSSVSCRCGLSRMDFDLARGP